MGRQVQRPVIRVRSFYNGERTLEEAFADAFMLIISEQQKMKSSADTFVSSEQSHYTMDSKAKEDKNNGTAA